MVTSDEDADDDSDVDVVVMATGCDNGDDELTGCDDRDEDEAEEEVEDFDWAQLSVVVCEFKSRQGIHSRPSIMLNSSICCCCCLYGL